MWTKITSRLLKNILKKEKPNPNWVLSKRIDNMDLLIYCPFCNQNTVPVTKHYKTVRNSSKRGGSVSHAEEVLEVLGECRNCHRSKKEIKAQFGL
jgi:hypothetical protein